MFDHTHYVPVIRWKRGESWALKKLTGEVRRRLTPLIELIPPNFDTDKLAKSRGMQGRMDILAKEILDNWGRSPFLIDLAHVETFLSSTELPHPVRMMGDAMRKFSLKGIPITGINRSAKQQKAAASAAAGLGYGVGIRVNQRETQSTSLSSDLSKLFEKLGTTPEAAHLVVDLGILVGTMPKFTAISNRILRLQDWRTLTVLGGAFPKDLSELSKNDQHKIPRNDWLTWRKLTQPTSGMPRIPTYGDYTVQHPHYAEPPVFCNPSASIRYTADSYWVIMRGEGIRNDDGPGFKGFLGNAMLLIERPEFYGEAFSAGDRYIREMSLQGKKTGNAETWIRAAINHHLTLTSRQISSLFGSVVVAEP